MRWIWPTVALVVAAGVAGGIVYFGQDTNHDVVLEHAEQINAVREDLQALVQVMPPVGSVRENGCPGVEPGRQLFRFEHVNAPASNTDVLMQVHLTDPRAEQGSFDPVQSSYLTELIDEVNPGYQVSGDDNERATEGQERSVEAIANMRYVVVVRVADVDAPRLPVFPADPVAVSRGSMTVEAVIADLESHQVLCTASTRADMTEYGAVAGYTYIPGETHRFLAGRLAEEGRRALVTALNDLDHGTFLWT